jgi:hypothetical protein
MIDSVVTHHLNPFRSGVARFNALLAERLGVPLVGLAADVRAPLLSFKASELGDPDRALVAERLPAWAPSLFLHEWGDTPLERALVKAAARVLCGNAEVAAQVGGELVWTPGLILESGRIAPAEVRVFTFGMAHKIRTEPFVRLRELLDVSGLTWAVRVSAANHETATLADAEAVFSQMRAIFGERVYFLGTLSDLAVAHELERATLFAAFFAAGVRANNTTVASAMERGAVVVTNLDDLSPEGLQHLGNVIDIERMDALPTDPLLLRRISVGAMEFARARSWERLVEVVRDGR